ncbi:hypothetical protein BUALT_Bualt07G0045300 [Buddleja alternifolia]|uniref:non-specific serine/threonine protein kinase n=1 Tax=Buddleja alternifolia TaxID=168488 RepID=A0AAV6XCD6_9LAMI|nr:hypothetical protein BUALT_Bualt07G0045300 [Buddleja alternifolia]
MLASRLTHLHIPPSNSSPPPTIPIKISNSPTYSAPFHPPLLLHPPPRSSSGTHKSYTTAPTPSSAPPLASPSRNPSQLSTPIRRTSSTIRPPMILNVKFLRNKVVKKMGVVEIEEVKKVRMKGKSGDDGIFAMKVMRKDTIIKNNHVDYMRAERDILTKVVHPFIVPLRYSFQTKSKLYLILDFINGGHLFYHLYRQGIFSEDQARVYTAEIVSAVSHLHKSGIVHRDLKPENILMDADGHVMLTDFGLAKEIDESSRSNSLCGTTEYMAPEILQSKGHNKNADWWSVGILLYEMLNGQPPYTHANRKKLQEKIINEKLKLPPRLTSEAHSLLKELLQKDPLKRLGSGPRGAEEIKSHKWFRTINWKKLEERELQTKFTPDVSGNDCTANFDKCWTTMPLDDSPAPTPTAGEHFHGYTYVAPNPWLSTE